VNIRSYKQLTAISDGTARGELAVDSDYLLAAGHQANQVMCRMPGEKPV